MNSYIHSQSEAPSGGMLRRTEDSGRCAAVLLLPAIAGLNPYISRVADDLAARGYSSLSLDYYSRTGGTPDLSDRAKMMAAVAALPDNQVLDEIERGVAYLQAQPYVDPTRIAILGFCIGGTYAILASSSFDVFRCAISFYGTLKYASLSEHKPVSPIDALATLSCPLLGHFGEADSLIPLQHVQEFKERIGGRPAEIYTYPGAGHAFHEDFRPQVYRPVASQEAWARSLAYLDWYCKNGY